MSQAATKKKKRLGREELTLNLMILPGLIILIIFVFAPLVGSLRHLKIMFRQRVF